MASRQQKARPQFAADFDEESGARAGVNTSQTNPVPGWGLAIKGGEALTELVVSLLSLFEYIRG